MTTMTPSHPGDYIREEILLNAKRRPDGLVLHSCFVEISRDEEAGVWYVSGTDFPGLVAEAPSERDLMAKIQALISELYDLNRHFFDEPALDAISLRMRSGRTETIPLPDR